MSPQKPTRPKTTGRLSPDPDIQPPKIPRLSEPAGLPGSASTSRPTTSSRPGSSTHHPPEQPSVEVSDTSRGAPTTAARPPEPSLTSYVIDPPEGLSRPRNDGIRVDGDAMYVDLADGKVTRVTYDPVLAAYCAQSLNESQRLGPALYRPEGETYWRKNTVATRLRAYQLKPEHRASFDRRIKGLITQDIHLRDAQLLPLCSAPLLRARTDADAFFSVARPTPRPAVPPLVGVDSFPKLVETILANSPGMILTENYAGTGGKMQLIDNMPTLAGNGVTTLYLDHFRTDIDQVALDDFHKTGVMSSGLMDRLRSLRGDTDDFPVTPYTHSSLISAAQKQGIRVRALDFAAYYWKDMLEHEREGHSAYHAIQVITADRLSHPEGKWVALIDAPHERRRNSNAYEQLHGREFFYPPPMAYKQVRLEGILNVRVEDAPHGPALRIIQEPPSSTADLSLEVGDRGLVPYELPRRYRSVLEADIRSVDLSKAPNHDPTKYLQPYAPFDLEVAKRARSRRAWDTVDASQRFFDRHWPVAKPPAPTLPPDSPASTIFERVYHQSNGLVLGATYDAQGARTLLIDNMQALAKQQVKTLYLENLITEFDQPPLATFAYTGEMPGKLRANLRRQDELQQVDLQSAHTLEHLITTARQHGLRVHALDTTASFRDELRAYEPARPSSFKYIAHTIIQSDQAQRGPHKWVALVASEHANTVRNVPGLAELQGAIGIRVTDVGGQPTRVIPDEGQIMTSLLPYQQPAQSAHPPRPSHQFVKSDLLVEVNVSAQPIPRPSINPGKLLHWTTDFLIEKSGEDFVLYLLPSSRSDFQTFPVRLSNDKFSVDIPHTYDRLKMMHLVKFSSLDNLAWTLKSAGMVQIRGTTSIPVSPRRLFDQFPELTQPGQYVINHTSNGAELFHRSRHGEVQLIQINKIKKTGKVYIDHNDWGMDAEHLYPDVATLMAHLESQHGLVRERTYNQGVPQNPS